MTNNENIVFVKNTEMVIGRKHFIAVLLFFILVIIGTCTAGYLMLEAKETEIFLLEKTQEGMIKDLMVYEQECEN